ncbi:MAG: LysR family transcriptional regulator [Sandaracinus sp.]|nr:LysR family transcriptional regulator [Sandaracinus sp.]
MRDWNDARLFLAVLRAGSFARASRELGLDASTLSRRVAELERSLDAVLFHRTTRSLEPTERALRLAPHAEAMELAAVALRRSASEDAPEGVVRVTCPEELASGLLVPAFGTLRTAHPEVRLELVGGGRVLDLERGEADVAVRAVRPERGELRAKRLLRVRYRAYASRGYLRGRARDADALEWLALDDPAGRSPEARWVDEVAGARGPVLRTNDTLDLATVAAAGWGAALLPDAMASRHPNLVPVWPERDATLERALWLVVPRKLARVGRVRAVMAWIEDVFRGVDESRAVATVR